MYRTRVKLHPFAGNYSHDRRFEKTQYLCWCLNAREEEHHLLSGTCPVYPDIYEQFTDFNSDENLVDFFNLVLARRDEIDDKE